MRTAVAAFFLLAGGVFGSEPAKTSNLRSGKRDLVVTNEYQLIRAGENPDLCMDIEDSSNPTIRSKIVYKQCSPSSWSQQWKVDVTGTVSIRQGRREMCVEAGRVGRAVQFLDAFLWPCNQKIHQQWEIQEGKFVNKGHGLRLGPGYCNIQEGQHVQLRGTSSCDVKEKFSLTTPSTDDLKPSDIGSLTKVVEGTINKPDAFLTGEVFTITAKSEDIWGKRDAFVFNSITVPTEKKISIEIKLPSGTFEPTEGIPTWAKAGLMIREADTPQSPQFSALITQGRGPYSIYRKEERDISFRERVDSISTATPQECWLRIDKDGNEFKAYYRTEEPENVKIRPSYQLLSTQTIIMDSPEVEVGIALSSHNPDKTVSLRAQLTHFAIQ